MASNKSSVKAAGLITIPLLIMLPIFFTIGAWLTYSIGVSVKIQADAKRVSEEAALAASSELCATESCWQNARAKAYDVLTNSEVTNIQGLSSSLSVLNTKRDEFLSSSNNSVSISFPSANLIVAIERGIWLPKGHVPRPIPIGDFLSLEKKRGVSYGAGTPKLLRRISFSVMRNHVRPHVFSNAVKVTVTRPNVYRPLFSVPASLLNRVRRNQTATSLGVTGGVDNIEPVPVAPVAIPLCNLLDENGEYRPQDREGVDLLVTSADWNCPIGTGGSELCRNMVGNGLMPSFDVEPVTQSEVLGERSDFYLSAVDCGSRTTLRCVEIFDHAWHFSTRYMKKTSSNFAVYAVPKNSLDFDDEDHTRSLVLSIFGGQTSVSQVRFGEEYRILATGLNVQDEEGVVLDRIRNKEKFSSRDEGLYEKFNLMEPSLSETISGKSGLLEKNVPVFYESGGLNITSLVDLRSRAGFPEQFISARNRGTCRSSLTVPRLPIPYTASASSSAGINQNVWIVDVPVIYNFKSKCDGESSQYNSNEPWRVIGFVSLSFYDASIGKTGCSITAPLPFDKNYIEESILPIFTPPPGVPEPQAKHFLSYCYNKPDFDSSGDISEPTNDNQSVCNFLRTRVTSNSSFIPWQSPTSAETDGGSILVKSG